MDTMGAVIDKDTGAMETPDTDVVVALRAVLTYTLTDAFALVSDESFWLGYELKTLLIPLKGNETLVVPLSVRQEMLGGAASAALERLHQKDTQYLPVDPKAVRATASQWAEVVMSMVNICFTVTPMVGIEMQARLVAMLHELGIDDPKTPRPSRYLPNDVRFSLAAN